MLSKKNFIISTSQESYKICTTLDSCNTETQLKKAKKWADGVIDRWDFFATNNLSKREIKNFTPFIEGCINEMSKHYSIKKKDFEVEEEKKPEPKPAFVVTGFC